MTSDHRAVRRVIAGVFVASAFALAVPITADAKPGAKPAQQGCDNRDNNTYAKLLDCVRGSEVKQHLLALQKIADANGGTRADQSGGYAASLDYVEDTMTAAGWDVSREEFKYDGINLATQQITPTPTDYDSIAALSTGEGDKTATIRPIDIALAPPRASTSGCEAADFAGFQAGDIALIQRGTCNFTVKVANAEAAGAGAVIIFNQGNETDPPTDRSSLNFRPDLTADPAAIPVVAVSFDDGAELASALTARVHVDLFTATSYNIIAELHGVNDDNIVMAGAHLDSVPAGPGINDNGSGSAALLEIGQQLAHHVPQNTIRLAWWGAEEEGLLGSTAWVGQQDQASLDRIALYMNFDMIASPNFIYMVYDANESTHPAPVEVPEGSTDIEATLESYLTLAGVAYDDTEFSGRSDYQAFIEADIPSSGLFTGAEEPKTAEQQAIWGGTTNAQLDPCYHAACDTIANINDQALEINSKAIAFAILKYSYSTESVNGVPGVPVPGNFTVPAPAGPEGTTG